MLYNFNPRLREGGDSVGRRQNANFVNISIHASAKEATQQMQQQSNPDEHFNPRLREGGDNIPVSVPFHHCISIHASAKEATNLL